MMDQFTNTGTANPACKNLFKAGAVAALIAALVFRRNLDAEIILLRATGIIQVGPTAPPSTIVGWFRLLRVHKLLGLTFLNVFDLLNYVLVGVIFLALYAALRRASPSFMALATTLGLAGSLTYFVSNRAFAMLSLSDQYAAATTGVQRATLLNAGQVTLAIHHNASHQGIYVSFLFVSVAGLIISAVMLRSGIFSKTTAYAGLLANGLGLGYYPAFAFAPALVFLPLSLSALFLLAWYIGIGRRLWRLASVHIASPAYSGASGLEKVTPIL
ncbi:MAG: DUF4386 family protein [Anaerolineales bacterium]